MWRFSATLLVVLDLAQSPSMGRMASLALHVAEKPFPGSPQGLAQFDQKSQRGNVASGLDLLQIAGGDAQLYREQFLTAIPQLSEPGDIVTEAFGMNGQRSRCRFRIGSSSNSAHRWHLPWNRRRLSRRTRYNRTVLLERVLLAFLRTLRNCRENVTVIRSHFR